MPKHNNVVPNSHFHKHWAERVRTWFDQPARKTRRRQKRAFKAARIFPKPVQGLLRPIVRCPTLKYNTKQRLGRGFSKQELKAAGIPKAQAQTIGISVDLRRKNKSEEGFQINVQLLKKYRANLILFPRKKGHPKPGDAAAPAIAKVEQLTKHQTVPHLKEKAPKAKVITDRTTSAYCLLRRATKEERFVGKRKKRLEKQEAKKAADAATGGAAKKQKTEPVKGGAKGAKGGAAGGAKGGAAKGAAAGGAKKGGEPKKGGDAAGGAKKGGEPKKGGDAAGGAKKGGEPKKGGDAAGGAKKGGEPKKGGGAAGGAAGGAKKGGEGGAKKGGEGGAKKGGEGGAKKGGDGGAKKGGA